MKWNKLYAKNRRYSTKRATRARKSVTPIRISLFSSSLVMETPRRWLPIPHLSPRLSQWLLSSKSLSRASSHRISVSGYRDLQLCGTDANGRLGALHFRCDRSHAHAGRSQHPKLLILFSRPRITYFRAIGLQSALLRYNAPPAVRSSTSAQSPCKRTRASREAAEV
jgi:hypothetical protein